MKILVIGSGGREHALVWKIAQSKLVDKIFCAPGNGGIAEIAECVNIKVDDIAGLLKFAIEKKIDLTVVGPEIPLVAGIVDKFQAKGLKIFGPNKFAAQLEGSKVFAKEFMVRNNIPTAKFKSFDDSLNAKDYIDEVGAPLVVKAEGLASGKGVIICSSETEAESAIDLIMEEKVFKEAGNRVVIEEYLEGEEASILAISDGENFVVLESSQDHKRIFDNDQGPNTGGMGAYSPAPVVSENLKQEIAQEILKPVIDGMKKEGHEFRGVLYAGLMITKEGPKVLEFNVRFGDPETQAILPRLKSDLVEIIFAALDGKLADFKLEWDSRPCVCVVMAAGGYPGDYEKNKLISGLDKAKELKDIVVFHAGTKRENGKILTSGGRVLGVTGLGNGITDAIDKTYQAVAKISFEKAHFRKDIGAKAIRRM
ncbi:MAG: phosphoribosylamine--glycine ligase [Candidatus Omnitrophica bacterium]|nr:phosphoribosylamine--glycine ligase [Candidatus Omnitrophota bacterium]HOX54490.1 phosphoribosylamine--glycine ligase [Candidatus Omnitrophota bacterium]